MTTGRRGAFSRAYWLTTESRKAAIFLLRWARVVLRPRGHFVKDYRLVSLAGELGCSKEVVAGNQSLEVDLPLDLLLVPVAGEAVPGQKRTNFFEGGRLAQGGSDLGFVFGRRILAGPLELKTVQAH